MAKAAAAGSSAAVKAVRKHEVEAASVAAAAAEAEAEAAAKLQEAAEVSRNAEQQYSEAHSFQSFRFLQSEDDRRGRGGKGGRRGQGGTKRGGLQVTGSETHTHIAEKQGGEGLGAPSLSPQGRSSKLLRSEQTWTTEPTQYADAERAAQESSAQVLDALQVVVGLFCF